MLALSRSEIVFMGLPFGRGLRNSHCQPAGNPTLYATRRRWQPARARLPVPTLPSTIDAQTNALRSACQAGAVGGFSIPKARHA